MVAEPVAAATDFHAVAVHFPSPRHNVNVNSQLHGTFVNYHQMFQMFARDGSEALKGEQPFIVLSREEGAMSKKATVLPGIAPLQCVVADPITDPAEQATLDKLHKREKGKQGAQGKTGARSGYHRRGRKNLN
jgi:hypothetical protein